MTRVIIAEKPDMGRKIAAALAKPHKNGNGYIETGEGIVTWCIGHIMKSFEPNEYNPAWEKWSFDQLPMLVEEWKIKVEPDKAKQFKVIKELLSSCSEAVNAGDPGREGQLIVDEVLHYLKFKKPVKRVLLYSLDQKSIKQAFANLQDNKDFHNIYEAGVCRGYADWTMGMNATRAYTMLAQKAGYKGVLSVGRVQSPTLAIVVRRDEEIDSFKPHDYATIIATFAHQGQPFSAYWKPNDSTPPDWLDSENRMLNLQAAAQISQKILNKNGIIKDYEEKDGKENAPLPFNLSKLQIYASAKWGMGAKEVLDTCQSLYEKHELQTYPRTDCQYLPENQFTDAPIILDHVKNSHPHLAQAVSTANPNLKSVAWNDSKLGEHFGLIPTKKEANISQLNPNEKRIYQAVCERYVAQFHPPCEYKTAAIMVECENETFKANGKVILKAGWRAIFGNDEESDEKKNDDEQEQVFPNIAPNQQVLCTNSKKQDKKTTAPPRFTEGTLINAMTNVHTLVSDPEQKKKLKEKKGIGQEATRTGILETLFRRTLFTKQGKHIISSPAARVLINALPKKVIDPALTAVWEDALDKIAEGKITAQTFKDKQNQWVIQLIEEAKKTQMATFASQPNTSQPPRSSGGKVSVGASTGSAKPASKSASKGAKTCPKCGVGQMVERTAKATGNKFLGCNNYPKCNNAEWPKK